MSAVNTDTNRTDCSFHIVLMPFYHVKIKSFMRPLSVYNLMTIQSLSQFEIHVDYQVYQLPNFRLNRIEREKPCRHIKLPSITNQI